MGTDMTWWAPRPLRWRDWRYVWRRAGGGPWRHLRRMWRWVRGSLGGDSMTWVVEVPEGTDSWDRVGIVHVKTVAGKTLDLSVDLTVTPYNARLGVEIIKTLTALAAVYWEREIVTHLVPGDNATAAVFQAAGYRYVAETEGDMLMEWRVP